MDFARRQLEKYGWKDGKGLGTKEDGIKDALKVTRKSSRSGLGHTLQDSHWWEKVYDDAANSIQLDKGPDGGLNTFTTAKKDSKESTEEEGELYSMAPNTKKFIKKALLQSGKNKTLSNQLAKIKDKVKEIKSKEKSTVKSLTDEELFSACGGRTAHKGARHGLTASGKLDRIRKQEEEFARTSRSKTSKTTDESPTIIVPTNPAKLKSILKCPMKDIDLNSNSVKSTRSGKSVEKKLSFKIDAKESAKKKKKKENKLVKVVKTMFKSKKSDGKKLKEIVANIKKQGIVKEDDSKKKLQEVKTKERRGRKRKIQTEEKPQKSNQPEAKKRKESEEVKRRKPKDKDSKVDNAKINKEKETKVKGKEKPKIDDSTNNEDKAAMKSKNIQKGKETESPKEIRKGRKTKEVSTVDTTKSKAAKTDDETTQKAKKKNDDDAESKSNEKGDTPIGRKGRKQKLPIKEVENENDIETASKAKTDDETIPKEPKTPKNKDTLLKSNVIAATPIERKGRKQKHPIQEVQTTDTREADEETSPKEAERRKTLEGSITETVKSKDAKTDDKTTPKETKGRKKKDTPDVKQDNETETNFKNNDKADTPIERKGRKQKLPIQEVQTNDTREADEETSPKEAERRKTLEGPITETVKSKDVETDDKTTPKDTKGRKKRDTPDVKQDNETETNIKCNDKADTPIERKGYKQKLQETDDTEKTDEEIPTKQRKGRKIIEVRRRSIETNKSNEAKTDDETTLKESKTRKKRDINDVKEGNKTERNIESDKEDVPEGRKRKQVKEAETEESSPKGRKGRKPKLQITKVSTVEAEGTKTTSKDTKGQRLKLQVKEVTNADVKDAEESKTVIKAVEKEATAIAGRERKSNPKIAEVTAAEVTVDANAIKQVEKTSDDKGDTSKERIGRKPKSKKSGIATVEVTTDAKDAGEMDDDKVDTPKEKKKQKQKPQVEENDSVDNNEIKIDKKKTAKAVSAEDPVKEKRGRKQKLQLLEDSEIHTTDSKKKDNNKKSMAKDKRQNSSDSSVKTVILNKETNKAVVTKSPVEDIVIDVNNASDEDQSTDDPEEPKTLKDAIRVSNLKGSNPAEVPESIKKRAMEKVETFLKSLLSVDQPVPSLDPDVCEISSDEEDHWARKRNKKAQRLLKNYLKVRQLQMARRLKEKTGMLRSIKNGEEVVISDSSDDDVVITEEHPPTPSRTTTEYGELFASLPCEVLLETRSNEDVDLNDSDVCEITDNESTKPSASEPSTPTPKPSMPPSKPSTSSTSPLKPSTPTPKPLKTSTSSPKSPPEPSTSSAKPLTSSPKPSTSSPKKDSTKRKLKKKKKSQH